MDEAPPVRRRSPWPWIVLAFVLGFCFLGFMVVAGIASLFSGLPEAESGKTATLVSDDDPQGTFVEIPVEGIIVDAAIDGPNPVDWVRTCLKKAEDVDDLKGVLLRVNSPGGGIRASEQILAYLRKFQEEEKVPLVVYMKDVAASGGYYVSMSSDWIVAANETITASIGVIWGYMNWQDLMENKIGVRFDPLKSAPMKDIASPDRPMTEKEHALLQGFIDAAYDRFIEVVVEGRKGKGKVPVTEDSVRALESTVLTGRRAFEAGLVDQIGFHEEAVAKLKELSGIERARVIEFQPPQSILQMILKAQTEQGPMGMKLRRLEYLYSRGPGLLALWER